MHLPLTEIVVRTTQGAELVRTTLPPGEYVIGGTAADSLKVEAEGVSSRHALLTIKLDHASIEDLGSGAGTRVNGKAITKSTQLWPNQKIQIGSAVVEVHRLKTIPPPDASLPPNLAMVRQVLPEEILRKKKYDIGGLVAQGGMGAVLDAREATIGRRVAMKVMLGESSKGDLVRFVAEAKVTGQLEHPNIVPVHELGVDEDERVFYTMKFVKGATLRGVLEALWEGEPETVKKYPLGNLLTIFQKVCDAIGFAHSKGVIHRDLKPENIMLGDYGEVLVMDWGLAKLLGSQEESPRSLVRPMPELVGATLGGSIMGTPQYMSPEQARGETQSLDARADIYALGAMLYHLLALRPSVEGGDAFAIVAKVARGEIDPLDRKLLRGPGEKPAGRPSKALLPHLPNGRIPDSLAAVVRKAMAFERGQRYPSVTALQADLTAYQDGFATAAEQASIAKQIILLVQRRRAEFATAFAALFILGAMALWFVISITASEHRATRNADLASKSEALAKEKERVARIAEASAVQEKESTRKALAEARIALTEAAFREHDGLGMRAALDEVPPDLRETNWSYLLERSDTSLTSLRTKSSSQVWDCAANPKVPEVFALLGTDCYVNVIDVRTRNVLREFNSGGEKGSAVARGIAFSPDGARIASSVNARGGIVIHSAVDGTRVAGWDAPSSYSLSFSADGTSLLQNCGDRELILWDATTGHRLWTAPETVGDGRAAFLPDGRMIAVNSGHEKLRLLNTSDGSLVRTFPYPSRISALAIHPNGHLMLTGDQVGMVRGWNIDDGSTVFEIRASNNRVVAIAFSNDGRYFATMAGESRGRCAIQVWDAATGAFLETLLGAAGSPYNLSIQPLSGELVAACSTPLSWDPHVSGERWSFPINGHDGDAVAFWGENELLSVVGGTVNKIQSLDLNGRPPTVLWQPEHGNFRHVAVSADGLLAVVNEVDGKSPLFLSLRKKNHRVEEGAAFSIEARPKFVRLSPAGRRLAVFTIGPGSDHPLRDSVVDPSNGSEVTHLDFDPDTLSQTEPQWFGETRIICAELAKRPRGLAGSEERLVLYDAVSGQRLKTVVSHSAINALAASPDGKMFAEGGADKMVRLRDAEMLEVKEEFRAHDDPITALAWHQTRPFLATASEDLSIKVWDINTHQRLAELRGPTRAPLQLSFSPSGQRVAALSGDRTVRVWEPEALKPGAPVQRSSTK